MGFILTGSEQVSTFNVLAKTNDFLAVCPGSDKQQHEK